MISNKLVHGATQRMSGSLQLGNSSVKNKFILLGLKLRAGINEHRTDSRST